jgi:hypothetical protein
MVTMPLAAHIVALAQAEQAAEPLLERLDPPRRAVVLMALLGVVLTGIALVACIMIGSRWVRRNARSGVRPTPIDKSPGSEAWREVLREALPEAKSSDTIATNKKSDEPRID